MGCFKSSLHSTIVVHPHKTINFKKVLLNHESINQIYTLQETLMMLPYGSLVKAVHNQTKILRAIQIINLKLDRSFIINDKHLHFEVKTLSALDHPNILTVFDILHDDLKMFVVMEYCEGGLLFDKIKQRGFINEKLAGLIVNQILSAVHYCHLRKVIHRDLNPKVIFLVDKTEEPQIKIAEFGSSVFIDPEHKFSGKFDSNAFLAPEVEKEDYNEKCDLWSVGVILYVLLCGNTPFSDSLTSICDESLKAKPISYQPLITNEISAEAIDLLQKLLIYDYQDRISAEEALKHPWFEHLQANSEVFSRHLTETFNQLSSYSSTSKLVDAVQGFIAKQVVTHKENKNMVEVFKAVDSDWDGRLSKEELLKYYKKSMPEKDAILVVEHIFETADADRSGFIEFSEFLKASADHSTLVSKANLKKAFKLMDRDNSGKLSRREIQSMLDGTSFSGDKKWMKLLKRADKNGDGEIDLKEFYDMLIEIR